MKIKSINPYNNEVNGEFDLLTKEQVDDQIKKSKETFSGWKQTPIKTRLEYLRKAAQNLRDKKREYGEIITKEMGKPIKDSIAEVEKCAWICEYYADNAEDMLKDEVVQTEAKKSYVSFEPLGIILAIMPWNYPFWQVFRFAAPCIAVGNVGLLKHASNVPMSAQAIERVFLEAGVPENVFKTVLIDAKTAMEIVKNVAGVTLTGSYNAGSQIGSLAGKYIKPLVLELGGSDPFIVLEDADIDKAAKAAVLGRHVNAGQSCISSKRFIVVKKAVDEFVDGYKKHFNELNIGDPMDESTDIGPVAGQKFVEDLEDQISDASSKGAEIIKLDSPKQGAFFSPTLVVNAKLNMKICTEEVFGPITPIITVDNEEEAVKIANDSDFGLGSSLWTRDLVKAQKLAQEIEAGTVTVNDFTKSDPRLPFGGIKTSGVGREMSQYGLKEFTNIKTVVIRE